MGTEDNNRWGEPRGGVRFFSYPRGRRDVNIALLDAGEDWMCEHGHTRAVCFPQPWKLSHYAFPHAYVSDGLDHIQALLRVHGYEKSGGEVFLDWFDMDPPSPPPVDELDVLVEIQETPGTDSRPDLTIQARHRDRQVGTCILIGAGHYHSDAADMAFCDLLDVTVDFQGKRLSLHLLLRGLLEARDRKCQHSAISTAYDNDRAFLFYSNHGYRVVDWTYEFTKTLV
ncbi:MAG TPA: hypothetical protein QF604_11285 [Candidatus Latescibacteria bacterium]|nr:hypothetical protein [Candidatus Latescibacterota bacterium]HJN28490.1 hypothetical protein [Candidatus Latescibacterota bacterium]